MEHVASWFEFSHKGKDYIVKFRYSTRRWYVKIPGMETPLKEYPWNGIHLMVNMQDAEDILTEYLGIVE